MNDTYLQKVRKHFEKRAALYDELGTWVHNEDILSKITSYIPVLSEKKLDIIDLGAGTGAVLKYVLDNYPYVNSMVAIDICKDMLDTINNSKIQKIVSSLEEMPFPNNEFDVALSRQCLHYVNNLEETIKEIKRVIKRNGIFILAQIVPLENGTQNYWKEFMKYRQPLRKHHFTQNEWEDLISNSGFQLISDQTFIHKSSVIKWAHKYSIRDQNSINEQKRILLEAPDTFIKDYCVAVEGEDVTYNAFWFVAKFRVNK